MARIRSWLHSPSPCCERRKRAGSCSPPLRARPDSWPPGCRTGTAPGDGPKLATEQAAQQLVADLDGGRLVAVDAAGEHDILAPARQIAGAAGRLQAEHPVSHTLARAPSGRSNENGSSCHSWRRVRAKKSCWGIIHLTLLSGTLGRIIRKALGLKINFKQIQTVMLQVWEGGTSRGNKRGRQQAVREGNGYNEENGPRQTGLSVTPWRRWLATVSQQ